MLYDFMGVVTLLVFVVAAVVGADRAWRFLSRKRELRASDLRGSGGHGPWSTDIEGLIPVYTDARDPFAAWDGKQFVPVDPAQHQARVVDVAKRLMLTQAVGQMEADGVMKSGSLHQVLHPTPVQPPNPALMAELGRIQGMVQSISGWRGTGGSRGDTVERVTEAGIRFNSRSEGIRETGPEAKWVP